MTGGEGVEPLDLDALEGLTAAATPGPWVAEIDQDGGDGYDVFSWVVGGYAAITAGYVAVDLGGSGGSRGAIDNLADAEFIAAARQAIPNLIAELRAHRTALAQIEAMVEDERRLPMRGDDDGWVHALSAYAAILRIIREART